VTNKDADMDNFWSVTWTFLTELTHN